jgi:hypothetical protein
MRIQDIKSCCLITCLALGTQSLADAAREEAERRRLLEQQGIEGKVIEASAVPSTSRGNRAVSTDHSEKQKKAPAQNASPKSRAPRRNYRSELQKLDRTIRQDEDRLEVARARLGAEKWALPKTGKLQDSNRTANTQDRLQKEIDELQIKLKELRRERVETYEEGRKTGLLPGELEGRQYSGEKD